MNSVINERLLEIIKFVESCTFSNEAFANHVARGVSNFHKIYFSVYIKPDKSFGLTAKYN